MSKLTQKLTKEDKKQQYEISYGGNISTFQEQCDVLLFCCCDILQIKPIEITLIENNLDSAASCDTAEK